jgi:hypothetical protein
LVSFGSEGLQAIGSEVAAETSRSAERNAPANRVAVSRAEVKVANIEQIPFQSLAEPDHRVRAIINAGVVPIEESAYFSVADRKRRRKSPVLRTST